MHAPCHLPSPVRRRGPLSKPPRPFSEPTNAAASVRLTNHIEPLSPPLPILTLMIAEGEDLSLSHQSMMT